MGGKNWSSSVRWSSRGMCCIIGLLCSDRLHQFPAQVTHFSFTRTWRTSASVLHRRPAWLTYGLHVLISSKIASRWMAINYLQEANKFNDLWLDNRSCKGFHKIICWLSCDRDVKFLSADISLVDTEPWSGHREKNEYIEVTFYHIKVIACRQGTIWIICAHMTASTGGRVHRFSTSLLMISGLYPHDHPKMTAQIAEKILI